MPDVRTWSIDPGLRAGDFKPDSPAHSVRPRGRPFSLTIQDWVTPRRGDLLEALQDGPLLDAGRVYLCTDVRQSRGGTSGSMLWRVEYKSAHSPSGRVFGPPLDRFRVALRHVALPP